MYSTDGTLSNLKNDFTCETSTGDEVKHKCKLLCYDIFRPISETRIYAMQLLCVVFAPIVFTSYATWVSARARELVHKKENSTNEDSQWNIEEINLMEKEIGKVRYKEAVHSDKVVSVVWTRKIRIAFVVQLLTKILIEIFFMFLIIFIQQKQVLFNLFI